MPIYISLLDTVQPKTSMISVEQSPQNIKQQGVLVHVVGAVDNPGVYTVQPGTKVVELVQALQLLSHAKLDHLNLAKTLKDGQKIVIKENQLGSNDKINVNFATKKQLMSLPGIGQASAQTIIEYRQRVGVIQTIGEVELVLGKAKLKKIKKKIQF